MPNRKILSVVALGAACGLATLLLFPFADLQDHPHWEKVGWIPFQSPPVRLSDVLLNVLLLLPLGVSAAFVFRRAVLAAGTIGFVISVAGESAQLYSHSRFPSATDVFCNVSGAVGAAWAVRHWRQGA